MLLKHAMCVLHALCVRHSALLCIFVIDVSCNFSNMVSLSFHRPRIVYLLNGPPFVSYVEKIR